MRWSSLKHHNHCMALPRSGLPLFKDLAPLVVVVVVVVVAAVVVVVVVVE